MNILQDFILSTLATDINVTINSLCLYVPISTPSSQTQAMFDEAILNNYTITFDSWYTEQKVSNDGRKLHVGIASAQHISQIFNISFSD